MLKIKGMPLHFISQMAQLFLKGDTLWRQIGCFNHMWGLS